MIVHLKEIYDKIDKNEGLKNVYNGFRIIEIWKEAVGGEILKNTSPIKFLKGILYVSVKNSIWLQELYYLKDEIIKKISDKADTKIKDIKFTLDRGEE